MKKIKKVCELILHGSLGMIAATVIMTACLSFTDNYERFINISEDVFIQDSKFFTFVVISFFIITVICAWIFYSLKKLFFEEFKHD